MFKTHANKYPPLCCGVLELLNPFGYGPVRPSSVIHFQGEPLSGGVKYTKIGEK